jgi:RNA polymerase sigma-70 factor (ECF subfamily)
MPPDDSFAAVLTRLQAGDDQAATEVFRRFAHRLIGLARIHLDARLKQKVDPEDVVQSVMKSFFIRQGRGEFELLGWESLWALLARITLRKCGHQLERYLTQARSVKRELYPVCNEDSVTSWQGLCQEPTPSHVIMLTETIESLVNAEPEKYREVVVLLLQGYSVEEIAKKLGGPKHLVSERSIHRVKNRTHERLKQMLVA